jgi:chemotaxis response regulator CheB
MTAIGAPTRVMVVDDSALMRGLWARLIDAESDLRVVASAWNGRAALKIVAQDEATSVVWGMPGAVAQAGLANAVVPLGGVAEHMDECARATR